MTLIRGPINRIMDKVELGQDWIIRPGGGGGASGLRVRVPCGTPEVHFGSLTTVAWPGENVASVRQEL